MNATHPFSNVFRCASLAMALCLASTTALTQAEIAQATTLAELTDQQLIEFSSAICYGTITDMNSIQTDAGFIVTAVDIDVIRWLKPEQNSSKTYTFYIRGGEYGDIVQNVHGEPSLRVGQSIVAFLEDVPRYRLPMLLGLGQGAFIQTDDPQIQPPSKRTENCPSKSIDDFRRQLSKRRQSTVETRHPLREIRFRHGKDDSRTPRKDRSRPCAQRQRSQRYRWQFWQPKKRR